MEENKKKSPRPYNGKKNSGKGAKPVKNKQKNYTNNENALEAKEHESRQIKGEASKKKNVYKTPKNKGDNKNVEEKAKAVPNMAKKGGQPKKKSIPHKGGRRNEIHDGFDDVKIKGAVYMKPMYEDDDYDDGYELSYMYEQSEDVSEESTSAVAGRNAVRELLRSGRSVDKLFVKKGSREGSLVVIVAEAVSRSIPVIEVSGEKLDGMSGGVNHQGVVAMAAEKQYTDVDGILKIAEERGEIPLVVIADCIEDPGNLGALIRCAECAGAHGIIIPKRRSAGLSSAVAKASAGAIEHMAIAKVSNISSTVEALKKKGLWIFASEAGGKDFYETDFKVPAAIIFGSEGAGIGRALKEKCDFLISIPMYGKVNSLNVSTAASVILCHAARMQRS